MYFVPVFNRVIAYVMVWGIVFVRFSCAASMGFNNGGVLEAVERLKKKYRRLVGNIGKTN
jgi:CO dehydrogenase/acetyl-CoA synthase alpha subunit